MNSTMRRTVAVLACVVVLALAPGAVAAEPPTTPPSLALPQVAIGMQVPLTGAAEFIGVRQLNSVLLAQTEINAAGGIDVGGTMYAINLVSVDSQCDAAVAPGAATYLLGQGVVAAIGDTCSGATASVQSIYETAGVLLISASSTMNDLTERGYSTFFRSTNRNDAPARQLARHLRAWLGLARVGAIQGPGPQAIESVSAFSAAFAAHGGTVVGTEAVASPADFATAVANLAALGIDALYYADGDATVAGQLSGIAGAAGIETVAWDTLESPVDGYSAAAGAAAEGDWAATAGREAGAMPGYADFEARYQAQGFAQYPVDPGVMGAHAYDSLYLIARAIDRADSLDPAAIRAELANTRGYAGVAGFYIGFDQGGDVIPQWYTMRVYEGGAWSPLEPEYAFVPLLAASPRKVG